MSTLAWVQSKDPPRQRVGVPKRRGAASSGRTLAGGREAHGVEGAGGAEVGEGRVRGSAVKVKRVGEGGEVGSVGAYDSRSESGPDQS